jgi:outer membrane cobalamin receptor
MFGSALAASAMLLTLAAQAPQLHESVVVTAAAEPVPFETAGRAVWVITRAEIARLPIRSIEDILRFAASVDVRARGPYVQADFSVRGGAFGQTLVLVDGIRINDAQSGHHNADIALTLDDIERVEVLLGTGASLFGADALAGTINIITRAADARTGASIVAGDFGIAGARVRAGFGRPGLQQSISAEGVRSSGFDVDRDFANVAVSSRTEIGARTRVQAGFVRKDFGANGFYGPAESREVTDQALASVHHAFTLSGWRSSVQGLYRTHGDRFQYDRTRPEIAPNTHRTHAATLVAKGSRAVGTRGRISAGGELGGDWIVSSNLGRRSYARASGFAELQQRLSDRVIVYPGVRYDAYGDFGDAWSRALAARFAVRPDLSLRASTGHAFRVPTFTERFYRDPNHEASGDLSPERGWSVEGGADWVPAPRTMARGTVFARRDRDVIDWIRASAAERWRTTNVRRVATSGLELGVRQLIGAASSADVQYTYLDTTADALAGVLSKYILDYAPHNLVVSGAWRSVYDLDLAPRIAWTRRVDGRSYTVVDLRAARTFRRFTLFVEAANLFDEQYQEIPGVAMPGRWLSAGVRLLAR